MRRLPEALCTTVVAASIVGTVSGAASAADVRCGDAGSGSRLLVSVSSEEALGDRDSGVPTWPSPSWSGRFVAFRSEATTLVAEPQSNAPDIFRRDAVSGTTELVSLTSKGEPFASGASEPSISGNGRYVAFVSSRAQADGRYGAAVYLRDTRRDVTTLLSKRIGGGQAIGSVRADVSRNGSAVVFDSSSPNLVRGDTNRRRDVFVWDRDTGKVSRVSVNSRGGQAREASWEASVSANGRYVAYQSTATELDSGEKGRMDYDVFVYDRISRRTARISVAKGGEEANGDSMRPSLSADGKYVLFDSWATNLVANDLNFSRDVFRLNRSNGVVRRASVTSQGSEADGDSSTVGDGLSGNGRYATFGSNAFNLQEFATDPAWRNVYVHDFRTGLTTKASASPSPDTTQAGIGSGWSTISGDGCFIAYNSNTSTQLDEDTDHRFDVFLYRR
jgi:Tol biopolymer transport system component